MGDEDGADPLALRLAAGVAALRAGRPQEAAPLLIEVCDDPGMIAAKDMLDIRTRALSLCSQALLAIGNLDEAGRRIDLALRLARNLGDTEGVQEIEGLREQIRAAAVAPPPVPVPATEGRNPIARAELLIRQANAELDGGHPADAAATARSALDAAPKVPRIAVLARLILARAVPERAEDELQAAVDIARDADEFTLVGLVARAAELAGVRLDR